MAIPDNIELLEKDFSCYCYKSIPIFIDKFLKDGEVNQKTMKISVSLLASVPKKEEPEWLFMNNKTLDCFMKSPEFSCDLKLTESIRYVARQQKRFRY